MITVTLESEQKTLTLDRANTVLQLLNKLHRKPGRTLVIRDNTLLTPDTRLSHGDSIKVRDVGSRG